MKKPMNTLSGTSGESAENGGESAKKAGTAAEQCIVVFISVATYFENIIHIE